MATIAIRPKYIASKSAKHQCLDLTLAGADWTSATFILSGVAGVAKITQVVNGPGSARVVVTTIGSAATGTLVIADGAGNSGTVALKRIPATRGRISPRRPERL